MERVREGFPVFVLRSEEGKTLIWQKDMGRVFQVVGTACAKVLWQQRAGKERRECWLCWVRLEKWAGLLQSG